MTVTTWRRLNKARDHRWVHPRVSAYLDGELPPRQERRLAQHREICPDCARMINTLHALLTMLPRLSLPPEAALGVAEQTAERVRAQIEEWS